MTRGSTDDSTDEAPAALAEVARRIASGEAVQWPILESTVTDEDSREVLKSLHAVEGIAAFHRAWRSGSPDTESTVPATWGALTIEDEIGRGSFGRVYRAWDPGLERHVALKILDPGVAEHAKAGRSVIDEGRTLARLRHPNVVTIHGADRIDGRLGLEMELISGRTLAEIVQSYGPLAPAEAALTCRDICRALAAVHRAGLVHRDIKAQNVMRERGGRVVLMDFGAVRLADVIESAEVTGTPAYLAPEVLAGATPLPSSDLYSVGVLLYYLLTGSFPVQAGTLDALRAAHQPGRLSPLGSVRPDIDTQLIDLVNRALAVDPAERIDSAGSFEAELLRTLSRVDVPSRSAPGSWPLVAGISVAVALGVIAWAFWR